MRVRACVCPTEQTQTTTQLLRLTPAELWARALVFSCLMHARLEQLCSCPCRRSCHLVAFATFVVCQVLVAVKLDGGFGAGVTWVQVSSSCFVEQRFVRSSWHCERLNPLYPTQVLVPSSMVFFVLLLVADLLVSVIEIREVCAHLLQCNFGGAETRGTKGCLCSVEIACT